MVMARLKKEILELDIVVNGDEARKAILDQTYVINNEREAIQRLEKSRTSLEKSNKKNTSEYRELQKEIKNHTSALSDAQKKLDKLNSAQSLTTMTMNELNRRARSLRSALNSAVPGSENFKKLQSALHLVTTRLTEMRSQIKSTDNSLWHMLRTQSDLTINLQAIGQLFSRFHHSVSLFVDAYRKQDEAMADAMKTTNLTKEEVKGLNEELQKLDTRTAQNELLGLARIGGKLGISGEEDLLAFVRAADKINVALKDDLGGDAETAIATVGKLVDIFQLSNIYGLEDALIKTGSAINDLGMASTANEGYVVDFTSRLAGIAPNANISITKILGLGATLDKYGQQAETAGTAIGQTIMAMFSRTESFASIAKMSLKEFSDLLNNDVNEALLRVLEGMNDGGGLSSVVKAMDEMHLNGQRASTILGTLSKNVDELRSQQELANQAFSEGSSLQDEFNVKNTSATAILEKHKKEIEKNVVAIGEQLLPVANGAIAIGSTGLSLIKDILPLLSKLAITIAAVSAARAIEVSYTKLRVFWSAKNRAELAQEITSLNGAKRSTIALSAAKNLLAGNFKSASVAAKMFFKSIKTGLGPIGWIILAIEGLLAVLSPLLKLFGEQRKVSKQLKETNEELANSYADVNIQIEKERSRLNSMKDAALKAKLNTKERADAIQRINQAYGQYLPSLLTEKSSNVEIANALMGVNTQLERNIKLKAKQSGLTEIQKNIDDQTKETMAGFVNILEKSLGKEASSSARTAMYQAVNTYKEGISKAGLSKQEKEKLRNDLWGVYFEQGGNQKFLRGDKLRSMVSNLDNVIAQSQKARQMLDTLYGSGTASGDNSSWSPANIGGNSDVLSDSSSTDHSGGKSDKIRELEHLIEESKKIIQSGVDDAKAIENQRYQVELAKFEAHKKDLIAAGVDYDALVETLNRKHQTKLSQIDLQQFEGKKKLLAQEYDLEKAELQNRHNMEIDAAIRAGEDIAALKVRQDEEITAIDTRYALAIQDLLDEMVNIDGNINFDITGLSIEEINALKIKLEELKALRDQMLGTGTSSSTSDASSESQSSSRQMGGSMLDLNSDEWGRLFDSGTSGWEKMGLAARAFGDIANQSMKIVSMAIRRQEQQEKKLLAQYRKANDKKRTALENRLNAGLITEAQYNASVMAMDAEYEAYQEELALKQAKREKAMSLTQAIINVAMGVTNALATMVPPFNFINAGLVAAMGATEIALIASTPITTGAEKGGDIFVRREQDGKVFPARLSPDKRGFISSPTVLVGEAGPEYVIPAEGVANPSIVPFLGTIEQARRSGTLRSLNLGAVYSPAAVPGLASGGSSRTSSQDVSKLMSSSVAVTADKEVSHLLKEILVKLDNPVPAVVSMLGPHGLVKAQEKYERISKRGQL